MDNDVHIHEVDQQRIDDMVKQYRNQITNLYKIAYLQGQIEQEEKARDELKARLARVA